MHLWSIIAISIIYSIKLKTFASCNYIVYFKLIIMEHGIFTANIILSMREYQKDNNIKKQCITNAQYLYDVIRMNSNTHVKTEAVFVVGDNGEDTTIVVGGHLVVVFDHDTIFDPSYDIFRLKNKSYFSNIKGLMNIVKDKDKDKEKFKSSIDIPTLVRLHIDFMKMSDQINNGELIITNKEHYNKQADYIETIDLTKGYKP